MKKITLFTITTLLSISLFADISQARRVVADASARLQAHRDSIRAAEDRIKNLQAQLGRMRGEQYRESFAQKQQELQQAVAQHNALVSQTGSHIAQLSQATQSVGRSYRVTGGGQAGSWSVEEPNYTVQKSIVYKDGLTTRSSY